jgi:hypothetical protein
MQLLTLNRRKFPRHIQQDLPLHSVAKGIRPSTILTIRDVLFNQASFLGTSHEETQLTILLLANLSKAADSYYATEIPHSCFAEAHRSPALVRWQNYWKNIENGSVIEGFPHLDTQDGVWAEPDLKDVFELELQLAKLVWEMQQPQNDSSNFGGRWKDLEPTIRRFIYGSDHSGSEPRLSPQELLATWKKHLMKKYITEFELELEAVANLQSGVVNIAAAWSLMGILLAKGNFNDAAQINGRCQLQYDGLSKHERKEIDKYWTWAIVLWLTRMATEESPLALYRDPAGV